VGAEGRRQYTQRLENTQNHSKCTEIERGHQPRPQQRDWLRLRRCPRGPWLVQPVPWIEQQPRPAARHPHPLNTVRRLGRTMGLDLPFPLVRTTEHRRPKGEGGPMMVSVVKQAKGTNYAGKRTIASAQTMAAALVQSRTWACASHHRRRGRPSPPSVW
jgi:hypothetical protein